MDVWVGEIVCFPEISGSTGIGQIRNQIFNRIRIDGIIFIVAISYK